MMIRKASNKDIIRTIKRNKKRFFSILLITALGVTMLSGLKAACDDLRYSANHFYDEQNLFDLNIVSTHGLNSDDLESLKNIDEIEVIEATYNENVYTMIKDGSKSAEVKMLTKQLNQPYLIKGNLPKDDNEIAVGKKYFNDSGKKIGDKITFSATTNINKEYTITGVVQDASDLNNHDGAAAFRSASTSDFTFFITENSIDFPIYTNIYIKLKGSESLLCFSDEYKSLINQVKTEIETNIKEERENARYDEIISELLATYSLPNEMLSSIDTSMIQKPQWYIQDRTSLSSYNNIQSDASSIEAVGTAFPIVFFSVAILIALTTITRMVEEERMLIGTYKALGFKNHEIMKKYLLYAGSACLIGGVIGDIGGFILLPKFVFYVFQLLYQLPQYYLQFDLLYGIGGIALFSSGIIIATLLAVNSEVKQMPAVLMRPKTPKTGSRVALEKINWIWQKLSFLNKVTARNLFRYKKRMLMTTFGIMGCSALVLCAMAINDSVSDLIPKQYEHIYHYDLMMITNNKSAFEDLQDDEEIKESMSLFIDNATIKNANGKEEAAQLMVISDIDAFNQYIELEDLSGNHLAFNDDEIYVTQNASQVLNFSKQDKVSIINSDLIEKEVNVSNIVQNYLGNNIYMSQEKYKSLFSDYENNAILANFNSSIKNTNKYIETLENRDNVLSVMSVENTKEEFFASFSLITAVVYLIISMAAALAFVVLFTLSTTNISERIRELATIKVLGFYDNEVHLYVNKETIILTILGILFGLPAGYALSKSLTYVLNMPSIHFAVVIQPISYLWTILLTLAFTLIVNLLTNQTLNKIDMIESLKSVE